MGENINFVRYIRSIECINKFDYLKMCSWASSTCYVLSAHTRTCQVRVCADNTLTLYVASIVTECTITGYNTVGIVSHRCVFDYDWLMIIKLYN